MYYINIDDIDIHMILIFNNLLEYSFLLLERVRNQLGNQNLCIDPEYDGESGIELDINEIKHTKKRIKMNDSYL